jgi:hypothetical protein
VPTDPISALIQGGAVAALVFVTYGFLSGKVIARVSYDAIGAEKDKAITALSVSLDAVQAERERADHRADEWRLRSESWEQKAFEIAERTARSARALDAASEKLAAREHEHENP